MEFAAPSPESSSTSDSRPSYSPHFMSSDLGLDPSDPLNLLLHNSSQSSSGDSSMEDSSQEGGSPPDWSQLSALWPENDAGQVKPYTDAMDFGDLTSLPMDMDFNPSMSIEPSALHFDPMKFANYAYGDHPVYSNDLLTTSFPFSFQTTYSNNELSSTASPQLSVEGRRRLSITSSSSSSGASFSPAPDSIPSPAAIPSTDVSQSYTLTTSVYNNDPAAALAERVRQSAGVMLALPMTAQLQALERNIQASVSVSDGPTTAPKLPIPRLPQHMASSIKSNSTVSSAASTPPPSTPSPPPSTATPSSSSAPLPRPKTSHTTIERRYRTNLNARIQSLRMAVPALRVVEDRDGGKKKAPNKVLVSHDGIKLEGAQDVISPGGVIDVIDERGFVDGVKVARKCSKANVLGKAVEYIRVLKRRENRLKAEQSGLKSLISGLVGGPALLREWEREWKENFGGEEKDEVEGEVDPDGDDEDSEDEQDDAEEEGRKRKRGKTAAVPAVKKVEKKPVDPNAVVPEKRKRGRPRKIVPPLTPIEQSPSMAQGLTTNEHGAPQYLLATFAIFSFFNSPFTTSSASSSSSHTHSGTVLNSPTVVASGTWGMSEYVQMFHLLVSVVVLLSIVSSWAGFGFLPRTFSSISWRRGYKKQKKTDSDWFKMGEECVLAGSKQDLTLYTRIQIYRQISSRSSARAQDLSTAALVMYGASNTLGGLAKIKARSVWNAAAAKAQTKGGAALYEKMVLEGMTVDEAFERLGKDATERDPQPPIQILASTLVKERVRKQLGLLFIGSVRMNAEERDADDKDQLEQDVLERQKTIEAAKEIGGSVGELGRTLERVWKLGVDCQVDVEDAKSDESGVNGEIRALLAALVLYRRLFPSVGNGASALLSPPPSPGREESSEVGMLRRALGSRAFEESNVLEDARDRAVDMVVELERRSVGLD